MRKIVKRSDGSEETVEGTPEEIREYERIAERERAPKEKQDKPGVLKGSEFDKGAVERLRKILEKNAAQPPPLLPKYVPWDPQRLIPNGWCSRCQCFNCVCRQFDLWPDWYRITCSSNRLTLS